MANRIYKGKNHILQVDSAGVKEMLKSNEMMDILMGIGESAIMQSGDPENIHAEKWDERNHAAVVNISYIDDENDYDTRKKVTNLQKLAKKKVGGSIVDGI